MDAAHESEFPPRTEEEVRPDREFTRFVDASIFRDPLIQMRTHLFRHVDEKIDPVLGNLPSEVRDLVTIGLNGVKTAESTSQSLAQSVKIFEASLQLFVDRLPDKIAEAAQIVARQKIMEGSVQSFLNSLDNVDQIAEYSCILMSQFHIYHSAVSTIFLDDSLRTSATTHHTIESGFGEESPAHEISYLNIHQRAYYRGRSDSDLTSLRFLEEAFTPAAEFLVRTPHNIPSVVPALTMLDPDNDNEVFSPYRAELAKQHIGIFPIRSGTRYFGALVNLMNDAVFNGGRARSPATELQGLAHATADAIDRVMRMPLG